MVQGMETVLQSTVPSAATLADILSNLDRIETETASLLNRNFPAENRINWKHFYESLESALQFPAEEKIQVKLYKPKTLHSISDLRI
jgi:hypothetical protein